MNIPSQKRIVRFDKYCPSCKYYNESEFDENSVCDICLSCNYNWDTDEPQDGIKYSMAFLNKLFKDTIGYIEKNKKNSDE